MHVTTKGQVTIPQKIREKLDITPNSEIDFVEEDGRVYIIKRIKADRAKNRFKQFRGLATVKMSTDEIMSLTRGDE